MPDKFTHSFLQKTIGLKGTNDRPFIPLLRTLGFIDQSGTPTPAYRLLKSKDTAKAAIAHAVRIAYVSLFEADENAHTHPAEKLKGLVAQVAGTDEDMTARIVSTFNSLVKLSDFPALGQGIENQEHQDEDEEKEGKEGVGQGEGRAAKPLRPEFHYNIQIHLPSNATEEVYLNIFNALRRAFQ